MITPLDRQDNRADLRRWTWLLVLAAGLTCFGLVRHTLLATSNPNLVPALILLGSMTVPAAFATFLAQRLPVTVATTTILVTALIGGVVGVVAAATLEYDTIRRLGALSAVAIGAIEEVAKLIGPLAILLVAHRRLSPVDGFILGVSSGAGFAALETMGYAAVAFIQTPDLTSMHTVDDLLLWRGLLSPAGHLAWTGVTTTALCWAVQRRWTARATIRFIVVLAVAATLHALWDATASPAGYVGLAAVNLGLLAYAAHRARTGATMIELARS